MRHPDVEEDEVRLRLPDEGEHLRSRLRLAHDLELAVVLEGTPDPVEDEAVVVGDHDSHRQAVSQGRTTIPLKPL